MLQALWRSLSAAAPGGPLTHNSCPPYNFPTFESYTLKTRAKPLQLSGTNLDKLWDSRVIGGKVRLASNRINKKVHCRWVSLGEFQVRVVASETAAVVASVSERSLFEATRDTTD